MILAPADRAAWLEARRRGIGASEAAAVLGISSYKSNLELWEEKTGRRAAPELSENPRVVYGKAAEAHLRQLFELDFPEYRVEYDEFGMIASLPDKPWLFATLDGALTHRETGRRGVLEIKTAELSSSRQWAQWDGRIPDLYFAQVCHQLLATGYDFAILKAQLKSLRDGLPQLSTRHYFLERTDENVREGMALLLEKETAFWSCVERDTPPPLLLPGI